MAVVVNLWLLTKQSWDSQKLSEEVGLPSLSEASSVIWCLSLLPDLGPVLLTKDGKLIFLLIFFPLVTKMPPKTQRLIFEGKVTWPSHYTSNTH